MATEDQIISYFQFYLQIMKKAAMEKQIGQNVSDEYVKCVTKVCSPIHHRIGKYAKDNAEKLAIFMHMSFLMILDKVLKMLDLLCMTSQSSFFCGYCCLFLLIVFTEI